ncbi:hypothetical protein DESPIG_01254 [Desulfovibrio piger ATCC 29098]|uniref:Uncharacterized protein n=1 Tax=Desulfovibrio piger ATCC 29098 TaxID=411464 RepID=B6WT49_9BACT|nr:hypothetical protein DESPIG_01254 [Desulfovibrio piger ATCC 29098]
MPYVFVPCLQPDTLLASGVKAGHALEKLWKKFQQVMMISCKKLKAKL